MELDEIFNNKYPCATFHDAILGSINLDYKNKEAKFELNVCVGDPDAIDEESRDLRYSGILTLTGLVFCVIEPSELQFYEGCQELMIADGKIDSLPAKYKAKFINLPNQLKIYHYFFVNNWNSFIFLGANDAFFEWK